MATTIDQTFSVNATVEELHVQCTFYSRILKSDLDKLDSFMTLFDALGGADINEYRRIYGLIKRLRFTINRDIKNYEQCLNAYAIAIKPSVPFEFQSKEMNFVQDIASCIPVVGNVLAKSMPAIGTLAKNVFDEFMHDTPPIKYSEPGNYALVDIPKEVSSLALSQNDIMPNQHALLSMDVEYMQRMTDIRERCKVPARIAVIPWAQAQPAGVPLARINVNTQIITPRVSGTNTFWDNTPISYFSQFFAFWRGGIRFTVECLPTKYHQGQLYLAFNPNLAAISIDGARNCTSATIDLGMNNRTSLDIPFVTQTDYLNTIPFRVPQPAATLLDTLGTFNIFVQNDLDSNGTVSTTIDINVYVEVMDDFEFKTPVAFDFTNEPVQTYIGSWQMNEEVVRNVHQAAPIHDDRNTKDTNDVNTSICCNVESSNTQNVLEREYLQSFGNVFLTSNNIIDSLLSFRLPDEYFNVNFATRGVSNYHELYRMDFKVTLRINPSLFHQGALIMYWAPLSEDMRTGMSGGTLTQLPHAILNIANETECSLIVPYSSMTRVLRSAYPTMGRVEVLVWNQLRCPSTAPQSVKFSVWIQAINAHMAVKRQQGAETTAFQFQGDEPSDTALENSTTQVAFKQATAPVKKTFILSKHDNVLTLLRRPDFVASAPFVHGDGSVNVTGLWQLPAFCGKEHFLLLGTYLSASGSNRFVISTSSGVSNNITMFAIPHFTALIPPAVTVATLPPVVSFELPATFNGSAQWHPGVQQQKLVELPYYNVYPMVADSNRMRESYVTGWPSLLIGYTNSDTTGTLPRIYSFHSVGDDFMVYFPLAIPQFRIQRTGTLRESSSILIGNVIVDHTLQHLETKFSKLNSQAHELTEPNDIELKDNSNEVKQRCDVSTPLVMEFQMWHPNRWFSSIVDTKEKLDAIGNTAEKLEKGDLVERFGEVVCEAKGCFSAMKDFACDAQKSLNHAPLSVAMAASNTSSDLNVFLEKWLKITEFIMDCVLGVAGICRGGALATVAVANLTIKIGRFVKPHIWSKIEKLSVPKWHSQGKEFPTYGIKAFKVIQSKWDSALESLAPGVLSSAFSLISREVTDSDHRSFKVRYDEEMLGKVTLTEKCIAFFQVIVDYIFEGTGYFTDWYSLSHSKITQLVQDFTEQNARGDFDSDNIYKSDHLDKLRKHYKLALRISKYGPVTPKFPVSYTRLATDIIKTFKGIPPKAGSARCVPTAAAFVGDSSVGKSYIVGSILPTLLLLISGDCKDGEEADGEVWARPTGQNVHFFDGYTQQKVMYVDDFLKNVDGKDADDMINLISCTQTPLEMAKLEEKGRLFKSDYILVTTNSSNFSNVHGLMCCDALCNRFKFSWKMSLKVSEDFPASTGSETVQWLANNMGNKTPAEVIDLIDKRWKFVANDVRGGHSREECSFHDIVESLVADRKLKRSVHGLMRKAVLTMKAQGLEVDDVTTDDERSKEEQLLSLYYLCVEDGTIEQYKDVICSDIRDLNIFPIPHDGDISGDEREKLGKILYYFRTKFFLCRPKPRTPTQLELEANDILQDFYESRTEGTIDQDKEHYILRLKLNNFDKTETTKTLNDILSIGELYYLLDRKPIIIPWKGVLKEWLFLTGVATACVAGGFAIGYGVTQIITQIYRAFRDKIVTSLQGQAYDTNPRVKPQPQNTVFQTQSDEDRTRKIRRNIRVIRMVDGECDDILCSMYCLVFESKFVLVPKHFIESYRKRKTRGDHISVEIELITVDGEMLRMEKVSINESNMCSVNGPNGTNSDLVLVYLANANINGAGKISQFIPSRMEFAAMLKGKDVEAAILGKHEDLDITVVTTVRNQLIETDKKETYNMILGTFCNTITKNGDCGRPYYFINNRPKPLYALHSAIANKITAGATPLILEDIMEAYNKIRNVEVPILEKTVVSLQCDNHVSKYWNTSIQNRGEVSINGIKLSKNTINKTDKRKWLEHIDWPVKYAPSYKGVTDTYHVMYTNAQKCIPKYTHVVEPRIHDKCVEFYTRIFPEERDKHILTEFECINGYGSMQRLVMSTSSGILANWFSNGKYEFFDSDGKDEPNYTFSHKAKTYNIPIFNQTFVERLRDFDNGIQIGEVRDNPIWVATVKDELRKLEKVEQKKTRIFEQPSLEYTLLVRKYFGAFLNYIKSKAGFVTHSAIGIDYEAAWKSIYQYLESKGNNGFDVDYTNYDGSVSPQAFDFYRRVTDYYYGDSSPARHSLLYILQNSNVLVGHNLMRTDLGNKSGNPMTDIFNSITNVYILYVSYLQSRLNVGLSCDFEDFHRDVALLTYGDDVIISADDDTLRYFNRISVSDTTTKLGFVATAADKSGNLQKFEKLSELQFLKSKFVSLDWCVLAPKPIEIAIRELQFISKQNKGDKRIIKDLFNCALRFAAHNGKDEVTRLQRQCADRGHNLRFDFEDFIQDIIDKQRVCGVQTPSIF